MGTFEDKNLSVQLTFLTARCVVLYPREQSELGDLSADTEPPSALKSVISTQISSNDPYIEGKQDRISRAQSLFQVAPYSQVGHMSLKSVYYEMMVLVVLVEKNNFDIPWFFLAYFY